MKEINVYYEVGKRIQFLRKQRGWSQEDLSIYSNISSHYISDLENGRRNPTLKILNEIAKTFEVTLEFLFMGIDGNIMD